MVSAVEFDGYKQKNLADIRRILETAGVRPVLLIGCGLTRRYLGAPNWLELLSHVGNIIGVDQARLNYLAQRAENNLAKLGSLLVDLTHDWAWDQGKNSFPTSYFEAGVEKSIFLKHLVAEHLKSFSLSGNMPPLSGEIELLKKVAPHAIITTNFDSMIDELFAGFELVVGERVIPMSLSITGEIYKIHGSVSDPGSLVLTQEDYERFQQKRPYISAKMMTYFAEYPVFILGYGLGDSNINAIISDLGTAVKDKGGLLDNIFYIEWTPDTEKLDRLKEEHVIPVRDGALPALRVRTIVTDNFDWILQCLSELANPLPINVKALRSLAARVVELVRTNSPNHKMEADYTKIESLTENPSQLAMILGISNGSNPNFDYPFILSQVAEKLGYTYWHPANELIKQASHDLGYDIKGSDNEYHFAFKHGKKQQNATSKYSAKLVELLRTYQAKNASAAEPGSAE